MADLVTTYSIVARDAASGQMGVAVQSAYIAVGAAVPWGEAGVGVVATQSFANIDFGPEGLTMMREGVEAAEALRRLLEADPRREARQAALLDASGRVAAHTGTACVGAAGHLTGDAVSVQANMMIDDSVWPAMLAAYEGAPGDLAARLIATLEAAEARGGDIRGRQSATTSNADRQAVARAAVRPARGRPSGSSWRAGEAAAIETRATRAEPIRRRGDRGPHAGGDGDAAAGAGACAGC